MKKRCWIFGAKRLVFKTNDEDRLPRSEKSTGVTGRAVPEKKITHIAEWKSEAQIRAGICRKPKRSWLVLV